MPIIFVWFENEEIAGDDKSEIIILIRFTMLKSAFPINKIRNVTIKSPIYIDFWLALFINNAF